MGIALNMIVGPYYEPFLEEAIRSAMPLVENIILVDTGYPNNINRPVMDSFPEATILNLERVSEEEFSYGDARELARVNTDSEWSLRLDADEILREEHFGELENHTKVPTHSAVQVTFWHHVVHPDYYTDTTRDTKNILYLTKPYYWVNKVHECCKCDEYCGDIAYAHHLKYDHYGYIRGPAEVHKRLNLYERLSDRPGLVETPDECLDGLEYKLMRYQLRHPPIIEPKLLELFPDLYTFPLDTKIRDAIIANLR